jgi:polyketide biosynthesis enoyl-CoA hydratase PksI
MSQVHRLDLSDLGIGQTLTVAAATGLLERLRLVAADPSASVVLVTGDPGVFCGGGNEGLVMEIAGRAPEKYAPFVRELRGFPLPVVIAMEGSAFGAGLGVALALGDFLVAAEESRYGFHFVRMGITPGMGLSFLLADKVGPPFAKEMLYSGRLYRGRELAASPKGQALFDRIVPRHQVLAEAEYRANQIAQAPRVTLV